MVAQRAPREDRPAAEVSQTPDVPNCEAAARGSSKKNVSRGDAAIDMVEAGSDREAVSAA